MEKPAVLLRQPSTPRDMELVRDIFREYAQSLAIDLCFQGFDEELAALPGDYAPPRGALLPCCVRLATHCPDRRPSASEARSPTATRRG